MEEGDEQQEEEEVMVFICVRLSLHFLKWWMGT